MSHQRRATWAFVCEPGYAAGRQKDVNSLEVNREKRGGGVGKGSCQNSQQRFTKTKKSDEMFKEQRLTKLIITALCKLGKPRHSLPFRNDCSKAFPPPFLSFSLIKEFTREREQSPFSSSGALSAFGFHQFIPHWGNYLLALPLCQALWQGLETLQQEDRLTLLSRSLRSSRNDRQIASKQGRHFQLGVNAAKKQRDLVDQRSKGKTGMGENIRALPCLNVFVSIPPYCFVAGRA